MFWHGCCWSECISVITTKRWQTSLGMLVKLHKNTHYHKHKHIALICVCTYTHTNYSKWNFVEISSSMSVCVYLNCLLLALANLVYCSNLAKSLPDPSAIQGNCISQEATSWTSLTQKQQNTEKTSNDNVVMVNGYTGNTQCRSEKHLNAQFCDRNCWRCGELNLLGRRFQICIFCYNFTRWILMLLSSLNGNQFGGRDN